VLASTKSVAPASAKQNFIFIAGLLEELY